MSLVGRSPKRSRYRPPDEEHGWHAFGLQEDAFRFVDARPDDNLRVWAAEINRDGGRKYYAANIDEFWRRYRVLKPSFRHFYELIRSGEPCLLYLDLEYDRAANPTCDGERMVATVVALLSEALDAAYGAAPRAADVVDLDSSTERKFSRHVLLRGAAFADNLHLGRFVLAWHAALGARRAAELRVDELWVHEKGATAADAPRTAFFVDLSVYSRNRCFRLYKSSKLGKGAELLPAGMSEEQLWFLPHADEEALFRRSLASDVPPGATLLRHEAPTSAECMGAPTAGGGGGSSSADGSGGGGGGGGVLRRDDCPYTELAAFMLDGWATKSGCAAGRVRGWSLRRGAGGEASALTLALADNRWCAHVGRPHRSNGVYLVARVADRCFQQFCFDADCRRNGFRGSDELPLPAHLLGALDPPRLEPPPAADAPPDDDREWEAAAEALADALGV